jgi:hypothetical protein
MVLHRDATVGGKSSSDSATKRNTTDDAGSSRVLRRALAAESVIDPASGNKNTDRSASIGDIAARDTTSLA